MQARLAGMKSGGRDVEVIDLDAEMRLFDQRLRRPLNYERLRTALLQEVAS